MLIALIPLEKSSWSNFRLPGCSIADALAIGPNGIFLAIAVSLRARYGAKSTLQVG